MLTYAVRITALTRALAQERHPGGRTCRQTLELAAGWGALGLAAALLELGARRRRHARFIAEAASRITTPEELLELARRSGRGDWRAVADELRARGIIKA